MKNKHNTLIRDCLRQLERVKPSAKKVRCIHDWAIAKKSLEDLEMMMDINSKKEFVDFER